MHQISQFDPTSATSSQFSVTMPNGGWIVLMNESIVGILLSFGNGQTRLINPFTIRAMRVSSRQDMVDWSQSYVITGAQAPQGLNIVTGETYDPEEWTGGEFILALPRLVNVGNPSSGGGVSATLTNDGNPAGTQVIEMTASSSASSNVIVNNDGTVHIRVVSNGAETEVLTITPGGVSTPATVTIHGTADTANAVPVAGIGSGTLPAGVAVPLARLGSGALGAGITIPGGQVSGAVASAASATSAATATSATSATNASNLLDSASDVVSLVRTGVAGNLFDLLTPPQAATVRRSVGARVYDGATSRDVVLAASDGTIPVAGLGAGALPGGVTLDGSQVISGSVAAATNATNVVNGAFSLHVEGTKGAVIFPSSSSLLYTIGLSGSGSATVALSSGITGGTAPFVALVNNTAGSNSSTMGSGSYTGTSVFIYQAASMAWKGIAFA